jgi:hypothetical protein
MPEFPYVALNQACTSMNAAPQLTVCWQHPSGLSRTNGQLIVALTNSHGLHAALPTRLEIALFFFFFFFACLVPKIFYKKPR